MRRAHPPCPHAQAGLSVGLLPARVALDNTVVSSLQVAGALARVLALWPGGWIVTLQVRDEAADWKIHGARVVSLLDLLESRGEVEYATPEPGHEGSLFTVLHRTLGRGESASIAIAHTRGFIVATDDRQATRACQGLNPPVATLTTEGLLTAAIADGLLDLSEAEVIWQQTGIRDPGRGIG